MHQPGGGRRAPVSARRVEAERIRAALEEDRFLVYAQPILDLKHLEQDAVDRYELLLRLRDDDAGELLLPGAFLYVAERFGLIQEIDCWVARKAMATIADHARAGRKLALHVNMSGKSMADPKVIALTEAALAKSEIDPSQLVFELTETAAIANIEEARAFALRLHARGCQLALDDFGTGFSSFYYLKTMPFDYFKIDGDFIRGVAANPVDKLVVQAIVDIARGMSRKTIAEFVTDDDTARLLGETGVDYLQGFHFGRPQPLTDLLPPV
jgi:EAL domain-containing protein (putative c-di-GMP-specific phosphodiesterase class I)